jgi:Ni/Co efflux regulator RcnB
VHRGYRFLSSLVLTAVFAAPLAMMAAARPQDDRDRREENRQGENHKRYYDKHHKDYHNWDGNEDRAYQRYQAERHERRAFIELNNRDQIVYWNWRHSNPDRH